MTCRWISYSVLQLPIYYYSHSCADDQTPTRSIHLSMQVIESQPKIATINVKTTTRQTDRQAFTALFNNAAFTRNGTVTLEQVSEVIALFPVIALLFLPAQRSDEVVFLKGHLALCAPSSSQVRIA
ncbi:hypothetical protein LI328DRAFT_164386 [Trichoderma asperelloides]|nr:hypothetical protein LI328DRAFT_164386 [Trichoderma asperelloides]